MQIFSLVVVAACTMLNAFRLRRMPAGQTHHGISWHGISSPATSTGSGVSPLKNSLDRKTSSKEEEKAINREKVRRFVAGMCPSSGPKLPREVDENFSLMNAFYATMTHPLIDNDAKAITDFMLATTPQEEEKMPNRKKPFYGIVAGVVSEFTSVMHLM